MTSGLLDCFTSQQELQVHWFAVLGCCTRVMRMWHKVVEGCDMLGNADPRKTSATSSRTRLREISTSVHDSIPGNSQAFAESVHHILNILNSQGERPPTAILSTNPIVHCFR